MGLMQPWLSTWFGDEVQRVSMQELSEGPGQFLVLSVSLLTHVGISGTQGSFSRLLALTQQKGGGVLFSTYQLWGWKGAGTIPVSCTPRRTHSFFLKTYHKMGWRRGEEPLWHGQVGWYPCPSHPSPVLRAGCLCHCVLGRGHSSQLVASLPRPSLLFTRL